MTTDIVSIAAWQRLSARTTTSGFLLPLDVGKLAAAGVRHVINLAPDGESPQSLSGEAELMAKHGLRYSYIPVPFMAPQEAHYEAFRAIYDADAEPVHVHCIANWRVSAFFYRYHVQQGMPKAEARLLMEQQWSPEKSDYAATWVPFVYGDAGITPGVDSA